jgi:uncharacterized protein YbjQ (UPF0145 family)
MQHSTTNDIAGYRIVRQLGLARGLVVRTSLDQDGFASPTRDYFDDFGEAYLTFAEAGRQGALTRLLAHAKLMGANAVVGLNYETGRLAQNIIEVFAYGVAVTIEAEPVDRPPELPVWRGPTEAEREVARVDVQAVLDRARRQASDRSPADVPLRRRAA